MVSLNDIYNKIDSIGKENTKYHTKVDILEVHNVHFIEKNNELKEYIVDIKTDINMIKQGQHKMTTDVSKMLLAWYGTNGNDGANAAIKKNTKFRYKSMGAVALFSLLGAAFVVSIIL